MKHNIILYIILAVFLAIFSYLSYQVGKIAQIMQPPKDLSAEWKTEVEKRINLLTNNLGIVVCSLNPAIQGCPTNPTKQ